MLPHVYVAEIVERPFAPLSHLYTFVVDPAIIFYFLCLQNKNSKETNFKFQMT